jgi:hypothetical protein
LGRGELLVRMLVPAADRRHSAPADMSAGLGRFRVGIRVREFPGLDLPHLTTSDYCRRCHRRVTSGLVNAHTAVSGER